MEQFAELVEIITGILEQNGKPLAIKALAKEINRVLADRPQPESIISKFLMRNRKIFVELSPGEWGLQSWNPANQGVSRITPKGSENPWEPTTTGTISDFSPVNQSLEELAHSLLDHLVPLSQDRQILDKLTVFHITQSSFKTDILPRDVVDTNCLVPPMLHEQTKNLSWRFPPMMQSTFFVRTKQGAHPKLDIRAIFGVASLLEYQEWRPFGDSQRISHRYVSKPEIGAPKNFAEVKLNGHRYYIRENDETKDFCQKSMKPIFYETRITQIIQGDLKNLFTLADMPPKDVIIKAYDEVNRNTLEETRIDFFKPSGLNSKITGENPRWALVHLKVGGAKIGLTLSAKYHKDWGVFEITIRLSNNFLTDRRRPSDDYTLLHSVILPHLFITVIDAEYILGPQQHVECLDEIRSGHPYLSERDQFIANLTTQTNCVLTRSTKSNDTLVMTPFGVYDTIRVNPIPGPHFSALSKDIESFISHSELSETAIKYVRGPYRSACLLAVMRALQRAFSSGSGLAQNLHKYQWKAIQNRIELLAADSSNQTTVIRAPTGTGKTLVFFANAAIHYLLTGQRAVMTFPTRILNEDMFKRLTRFIYALCEEMQIVDSELAERILGGILIGTSDPSYQAIVSPIPGEMMVQYDGCPKCQEKGKRRKVICQEINGRLIGVCEDPNCKHTITYMAGPKEVADMLPALTIATPDKLFYEATMSVPQQSLRFFGAPCIHCKCGYHISLLNKAGQIGDSVECPKCGQIIDIEKAAKAKPKILPKLVKSPPLYFVLDEVHSLYGITATLISYFFSLLRDMARSFEAEYEPTFETGTATIANEQKLIKAMTHQEMMAFPSDEEFFDYFAIESDRIRYRSVMFMPVGKATRSTITNSILAGYQGNQPSGELANSIKNPTNGAYDFLLAYIPRKVNGYIIANEIRRVLDDRSITFLSGDAPTARLVTLLKEILDGSTNLLLANVVVSLGIDIPRLNNMMMLGIPKSMTEMVQTVGRTGRGRHPGHVVIHLQPSIPRDEFVYRHFHRIMGDVTGYFDSKPVAPINTYVADLIFINVLHAILSTRLMMDYRNCFANKAGNWLAAGNNRALLGRMIKEILGRGGTNDLQREIAKTIQPRLMEAMVELSTKSGFLSDWVRNHPDALYSLHARADRVPLVIGQTNLLERMKKGFSPDLRPVEEDLSNELIEN